MQVECAQRAEILVWHKRQNRAGDRKKLQGHAGVFRREVFRDGVERRLSGEQQQRGHCQHQRSPCFAGDNESSEKIGEQAGGDGGESRARLFPALEIQKDPQPCGDSGESGHEEIRLAVLREVGADRSEQRPKGEGSEPGRNPLAGVPDLPLPLALEADQCPERSADEEAGQQVVHPVEFTLATRSRRRRGNAIL